MIELSKISRRRSWKETAVSGSQVFGCKLIPRSLSKTARSEEHTSELQSRLHLVCRLLLEKKKNIATTLNASHTQSAGSLSPMTSFSPLFCTADAPATHDNHDHLHDRSRLPAHLEPVGARDGAMSLQGLWR